MTAVVDALILVATSIAGATLYHYLSDQDVPFEYELGIGQMAALLFVLSAGSQGLYRLHAVLSPVRRIVVTLAITLLP